MILNPFKKFKKKKIVTECEMGLYDNVFADDDDDDDDDISKCANSKICYFF